MTDLEKLLAEVTPDWRPGGRFKAVISDGITGWDDPETVAGYRGHLVCESVNHPAIMELICMAPALARKVIAAEKAIEALRLHQAWSDSEDAGPDYGEQSRDTHPDGERIWRQWWDGNLSLCGRAQDMTREAIAAWDDCQ